MRHSALEEIYLAFKASSGICTDSRLLQPGQLFLALKGPNFDGNRYAAQALNRGAIAVVVDAAAPYTAALPPEKCFWVADGLLTLQALAHHHRRRLQLPLLGLTGSNGKTTTKELLALALGKRFTTFATPGNLNNPIGLPLSLLQLKPEHTFAVLEMGDNHPGDIAALAALAEPTCGLITNIGQDHLGYYGSMEANAATKLELFHYLKATGGLAFVNLADGFLTSYKYGPLPSIGYGPGGSYQVRLLQSGLQGLHLQIYGPALTQPITLRVPLYGAYNLQNLLAAATVAFHFGNLAPEELQEALAAYRPTNNRSEVRKLGRLTVVLDAYNANPSSMQPALEEFLALQGNKLVVLGAMQELGGHSRQAHEQLGELLSRLAPARLLLVGDEMRFAWEAYNQNGKGVAQWAPTTTAAVELFKELVPDASLLLLKGSRGFALEKLLDFIPAEPAAS